MKLIIIEETKKINDGMLFTKGQIVEFCQKAIAYELKENVYLEEREIEELEGIDIGLETFDVECCEADFILDELGIARFTITDAENVINNLLQYFEV